MTRPQEDTQLNPIKTSRRGFVSGVLGLGAAGAGVAMFGGSGTPRAASEATPRDTAHAVGYHETDHIRSYYRSAS